MEAAQAKPKPKRNTPQKKRWWQKSENRFALIMISPAIITLLVIGLYPLLFAVDVSLSEYMLTRPATLGDPVGLENFQTVLEDELFINAMARTFVLLLAVLPLQLIFGIAIALLLKNTRWRALAAVLRSLLVIPFAMTPAVVGLLSRLLYNRDFGFLNWVLSLFGLEPVNWLGDPTMAFIAIGIVDLWQWVPFVALVMLAGLTLVPEDAEDAAKLDTDSLWTLFTRIQLPYLLPGITAVLILRTIDILKLFDMPFILTRGGPGVSTEFISLYVQRVGFRIFDLGVASAQAIILLIIVIVLSRLYIRLFYREVATA